MRIVFFDLETGGLDPDKHPIIQAAFVAVSPIEDGMKELAHLELKIQFSEKLCDPKALEMNNYNPDVWNIEAHSPDRACAKIVSFLEEYKDLEQVSKTSGKAYRVAQLAGYNAQAFDFRFLQAWFKRREAFLPASFRVLDSYQLALWFMLVLGRGKETADYKLGSVAEALGIPLEGAEHDALADCRRTVAFTRALLMAADNVLVTTPPLADDSASLFDEL